MEALFKKYFWAVKGLGFAAAAALAASAISTQLGTRYLITSADDEPVGGSEEAGEDGDEDGEGPAKRSVPSRFGSSPFGSTPPGGRTADRSGAVEAITSQNIFCPTCKPVDDDDQVAYDENGNPIGPVVGTGESRSSLPLILVATMEATDSKYSFATVFDQDTEVSGLYGIGELIRPGVVVTSIERGMLHLRNGPSLEFLELREDELRKRKATKSSKPNKAEQKTRRSQAYVEGSEDAINCPSEDLCVVERAFVEKILANPASLAKQARILPTQKDGETTGFKLYGIRRDSLPRMLGLKNGDMLKSVNGQDLASVDQAMGLYAKLRHASNLSVTIDRRGQTVTKEIQIK